VVTTNDPSLQDRNDSAGAVPAAAYHDVELPNVIHVGGPLHGMHVDLVDRQPPNVAPPDGVGSLAFDREEDGFEDVNAYFHIDRNQTYLQSLGYKNTRAVVGYAIDVDAHAASGADNSFFLPSLTDPGKGALFFGEGGTDDAEDADLLVHEYAHAIHEWIAPGTFTGAFGSEARAFAEAFGDYWAYSAHAAARRASGRDPFCFADWDARCWEDEASQQCSYPPGSDCLRRLDSTLTMADYDRNDASGVEHRNGRIFSSALREIHESVGRQVTDTIVIESLFTAPPNPTYADMAQRMIFADQLLHLGQHVPLICSAMEARGILETCDIVPRGELTLFQSPQHGIAIPETSSTGITSTLTITDTRAIERIYVRIDIAHTARGDLRIELIAPDGTTVLLHQISTARTPDIHATFGLDTATVESLDVLRGRSAAGVWSLVVADRRPRDTGTLLSWGLVIRFAGDEPQNDRPRGEQSQMIPAVAHVYGGSGAVATDLRIANPKTTAENATLIFTRSGHDGRTRFRAVQVPLAAGQTVAFDDVVAGAFFAAGFGTLEVLGDVVVMSRTYTPALFGTYGQQIPPNPETTVHDGPPLYLAPVAISLTGRTWRSNLGLVEVGGAFGRALVRGRDFAYDVPVQPYSNVQFTIPPSTDPVEIIVLAGEARIGAYLSQVDNENGDGLYIPAVASADVERTVIAPAISHVAWTSDVRLFATEEAPAIDVTMFGFGETIPESVDPPAAGSSSFMLDLVHTLFDDRIPFGALRLALPRGVDAVSRVTFAGHASQFVPFRELYGPSEQHLVFIESGTSYRTNIGIVSDRTAVAEVTIYDSAGAEVDRWTLLVIGGGMAQERLFEPVIGGRAVVRFIAGAGQAYASLVDVRTHDPTFVWGQ
jgi:subtilisin-like proprotein convertase family protein